MARLIDADALLELLKNPERYGYLDTIDILNAPTIEAEPVKHGKWIVLGQRAGMRYPTHYCSECGEHGWKEYQYCQHCGARMDGE